MKCTILIADDEIEILEIVKLYLEKEGYKVITSQDGVEALSLFDVHKINLVILDIMMPKLNGIEVLKKIRQKSTVPVIMLSAKGEDYDKILGITLGADDYLSKPFNPLELVARVQGQLRRSYDYMPTQKQAKVLKNRSLKLYEDEGKVTLDEETLDLTATEFKLLRLLMSEPGRIFTRQQIFESIWEDSFVDDHNTIMVHISNLRNKIEKNPKQPIYLKTIKGLGYKIEKE